MPTATPGMQDIPSDNNFYDNYIVAKLIYYEPFDACSCVAYYKYLHNIPQKTSLGNAWDIQPLYLEPQDEGMIITSEGQGHVADYRRVGNKLYLREANYIPCQVSERIIDIDSPFIIGYR